MVSAVPAKTIILKCHSDLSEESLHFVWVAATVFDGTLSPPALTALTRYSSCTLRGWSFRVVSQPRRSHRMTGEVGRVRLITGEHGIGQGQNIRFAFRKFRHKMLFSYKTTAAVLDGILSPPALTALTRYSSCGPRGWSARVVSVSRAMPTCDQEPNSPPPAGCSRRSIM